MPVSNDFIQYVLDQLSAWENVHVNRMFGGAALYHDDLAFAMIAYDTVYLKVDESNIDKYLDAGSKPLKPFKTQATVLSFYNVPPDVFEDSDVFIEWCKESLAIQKKKKKLNY